MSAEPFSDTFLEEIKAVLREAQAQIRLTGGHRYQVFGVGEKWEYQYGVTTSCGVYKDGEDHLMNWSGEMALKYGYKEAWKDQRDAAGDKGTDRHTLIEGECRRMLGESVPLVATDEELLFLGDFRAWAKANDFQPIAVEQRLYSKRLEVCGTMDCLGYFQGQLEVLDWKGKDKRPLGPYPKEELQNVAYRALLAEMCGRKWLPIGGRHVYLPRPEANFKICDFPITADPDKTLAAFENVVGLYRWQREREKPKTSTSSRKAAVSLT